MLERLLYIFSEIVGYTLGIIVLLIIYCIMMPIVALVFIPVIMLITTCAIPLIPVLIVQGIYWFITGKKINYCSNRINEFITLNKSIFNYIGNYIELIK